MISTVSCCRKHQNAASGRSDAGTEKKSDRPIVPILMPITQEYHGQRFFVRTLEKACPHKLED
jgi:hypothetical protein